MLDYDGTLAPFVEERMEATPYPGVKDRLIALASLKNTRTVIVSGRKLSDLEIVLDLQAGLEIWGSHGCERKLADGTQVNTKLDANLYEGLNKGKQACTQNVTSESCEIKPYSIALHWRGKEATERLHAIKAVEKLWQELCKTYALEIHAFDGGIELRPTEQNKGHVVKDLLKEISEGSPIAYLGDDMTDEDAFAALGNRGLKVLVREQSRPTLADIHLIPPHELFTFLDLWLENA